MLNPDYKDMLVALCEEKTDFLIVGAYALAVYGLPQPQVTLISLWDKI